MKRKTCSGKLNKDDFFVKWRATKTRNVYEVRVSVPSSEDFCNIMQEPIANASMDFKDTAFDCFFADNPDTRKATLPCNHIFFVTAIAYHFMKNGMQCPVCRAGEKNTMNAQNIPKHIRKKMLHRIKEIRREELEQERRHENEENAREIHRIMQEEILHMVLSYRTSANPRGLWTSQIAIKMYAQTNAAGNQNASNFVALPMRCHTAANLHFHVPPAQMRLVHRFASMCDDISSIRFAICYNSQEISITRSLAIPLSALSDSQQQQTQNTASYNLQTETFCVENCSQSGILELSLRNDTTAGTRNLTPISEIKWAPELTYLTQIVLENR
jgi:hypothetical protein